LAGSAPASWKLPPAAGRKAKAVVVRAGRRRISRRKARVRNMKVVLFCGGLGTRLREYSDTMPKPLVNIGYRPILWNLMRYYAHYGHKDFILCLGYRGDMIKDFFLNYNECVSNDFVLTNGGKNIELLNSDLQDWRITFVETGLQSNIGQRLVAVKEHVKDEEYFLANYSDGLSDLPLDIYIDKFFSARAVAGLISVRTLQSFHTVHSDSNGIVSRIGSINGNEILVNGGFFVLKNEIFDYIKDGEELVEEPFRRLIAEKKLFGYEYKGFWRSMDTLKDKITFDELHAKGDTPWEIWKK
jgi:glucose-1-phosphate cytidylyltransferase